MICLDQEAVWGGVFEIVCKLACFLCVLSSVLMRVWEVSKTPLSFSFKMFDFFLKRWFFCYRGRGGGNGAKGESRGSQSIELLRFRLIFDL